MSLLATWDPQVQSAIDRECRRQASVLELIASENFTSPAVLEAAGTCLTNKYAEGYPGRRYYGGCEVVDEVEELARTRACRLFDAEHANVQPHSGSQANMGVFFSLLKPHDTVLGMNLSHGGHLTHGSPVNFSGSYYNFVFYGVDRDTETIDYDEVRRLARQHRPKLIIAGASAYPRTIDFARFAAIAADAGCPLMVDMAHTAGLSAAGLHPNPAEHADYVTSTTHKTLRGPRGGFILTRRGLASGIDKAIFPGIQGGPLMHIIAAKAVAFGEALRPEFKEYQKRVLQNARTLATALVSRGVRLVSGGTDNHLMLVDVTPLGLTGRDAEKVLERVGITVNKNTIPYDQRGPNVTSGIRIGTPALTTRGMSERDMQVVGGLIADALEHSGDEQALNAIQKRTRELAAGFPWPQATDEGR